MEDKNANSAVRHIRVGGVECTIWRNETDGRTSFSVTMQRNYKDRSG